MESKYNIEFYSGVKKFLNIPMKLFFKPTIEGIENLPDKPYILAGNHKSLFDIPFLITSIPDEIHFMAKKELFKFKLLRKIFLKMGSFPVDREKVDIRAIKESLKILKSDEILGIFPEGTRNKTNNIILPFKDGVTSIANKTNSLIVPFGISGEYKLGNKIYLNIGKPIDIKFLNNEEQKEYLEKKVKELILK